eukprot:TRINITY_DN15093_c0_g1_i1.p1 TRINITY_DN15093_c0_g1~~TRINITY_DN15093_c0_g1_i1.p1  ORF type:complete len:440 (-),score=99.10 TRINITY_DN15093_c0_g1_i1:51-1310(-)
MAKEEEAERQPLLPRCRSAYGQDEDSDSAPGDAAKVGLAEPLSTVSYRTEDLGSMWILFQTTYTVWRRPGLWWMAVILFFISMLTSLVVLVVVKDPAQLQVGKFAKISTFLNVFVGLLLGFFMSSSMNRWYSCANGFLELQDAVRNMQMQLYALGVEEVKSDHILRLGTLSACLLAEELNITAKAKQAEEATFDVMWASLQAEFNHDLEDGEVTRFSALNATKQELNVLRKVEDPPGVIWTWVAGMLGRMAQDGDVPSLASPTYGRLMNLAQDAHSGIRAVRSAIHVQPPYIYVQMLATLVHLNNLINALSFGMSAGASVGTAMQRYDPAGLYKDGARMKEVAADTQNLIVSFFFSCFGPFIYQALLQVAIAIAQPFSSRDGEIPTKRLLRQLEKDLDDGAVMIKNMPIGWEPPTFKIK